FALWNLLNQIIKPKVTIPIKPILPQVINFPRPTINQVVHTPPSLITVIELAPCKPKCAALAEAVTNGATQEAMYKVIIISTTPPISVLKISPPNTAAIIAIIYGMVAKSPNGRVLFPGKITAINKVIGTKIKAEERTVLLPAAKALYIPMYNFLPGKSYLIKSCAASEIRVNTNIQSDIIRYIKTINAAVITPSWRTFDTEYFAKIPITIPIINPITEGSSKTPILF